MDNKYFSSVFVKVKRGFINDPASYGTKSCVLFNGCLDDIHGLYSVVDLCPTHLTVNAIIVEVQHLRQATVEYKAFKILDNGDRIVVVMIESAVMLNMSPYHIYIHMYMD